MSRVLQTVSRNTELNGPMLSDRAKQSASGCRRAVIVHCLLPMFAGAMIYLLWRDPQLLLFDWLNAFGLSGLVQWCRDTVGLRRDTLPHWFLYNLPDGLWAYGLTSALCLVWAKQHGAGRMLWLASVPVLAIASEFGQRYSVIPGTYEFTDVVSYAIAWLAALAVFHQRGESPTCDANI